MSTSCGDGTGYPQTTHCPSTSSQTTDAAIELQSPRYSSEAATEVADVLSPQPRPGANRGDCAVVAVVRTVPLATDVRAGSCRLELGPLTRVRHGESGLGGIGACALSGIVSVSLNVTLVSESSSESVNKADSLGREDGRTGALSFLGVSGGGFSGEGTALTLAAFPDEPDADKSLATLAEVHSHGSGRRAVPSQAVGSNNRQAGARRATAIRRLGCRRHGVLQCREVGCRR